MHCKWVEDVVSLAHKYVIYRSPMVVQAHYTFLCHFFFQDGIFPARTSAANKINEAIISLCIFLHIFALFSLSFRLLQCFEMAKLCNKKNRKSVTAARRLFVYFGTTWLVSWLVKSDSDARQRQCERANNDSCTYYFMNFNKSSSNSDSNSSSKNIIYLMFDEMNFLAA